MATQPRTIISDAARAELLDRAAERGGYVLASELLELTDLLSDASDVLAELDDDSLELVDDVADETATAAVPAHLSADPVRQYLNEAGRFDLLDAEREQDLAKRYQAGLLADDLLAQHGGDLSERRRALLEGVAAEGARAKDALIASNLRLVVPTAKKYAGDDFPFIEALQEGNLGLIRAVEKFDHTKGYKFSTYAVWWIRQAIQRGLARRSRTIRVPSTIWEQSGKLRRAEADLRTQLGRDPKDHELAEASGLKVERIREIRDALRPLTSLDRPVGEDGSLSLGELLDDPSGVDPSVDSARADVRNRIFAALSDLTERERAIIDLRFGLSDGEPRTLEQVGREIGLTRERVRQLERDVLVRLRDPAAAHGLHEALGIAA